MIAEFKKTNLTSYVDVSSTALGKGLVVIWDGTLENYVKLPGGANCTGVAGVNNFAATVSTVNTIKQVSICSDGDVYCIAAHNVAIGDQVMVHGSDGYVMAVPAGATPAAAYNPIGEALTAATQAGDRILVRLKLPQGQTISTLTGLTN
jgi:hypothetical protein